MSYFVGMNYSKLLGLVLKLFLQSWNVYSEPLKRNIVFSFLAKKETKLLFGFPRIRKIGYKVSVLLSADITSIK